MVMVSVGQQLLVMKSRVFLDGHASTIMVNRGGRGEGRGGWWAERTRGGGEVEARLRRVVEMRVANCKRVAMFHESVELKQIAAKATGTEKPLGRWTTQLTLAPGGSIRAGAGLARHFA